MRYAPIEHRDAFTLEGREIADGDRLELKWPGGQIVLTTIKIIHGELRIVGTIHGIRCWIVLNHGIGKREILACWPDREDGYGQDNRNAAQGG
jgi:hypothetical protein